MSDLHLELKLFVCAAVLNRVQVNLDVDPVKYGATWDRLSAIEWNVFAFVSGVCESPSMYRGQFETSAWS
jgi:hypothetical protein